MNKLKYGILIFLSLLLIGCGSLSSKDLEEIRNTLKKENYIKDTDEEIRAAIDFGDAKIIPIVDYNSLYKRKDGSYYVVKIQKRFQSETKQYSVIIYELKEFEIIEYEDRDYPTYRISSCSIDTELIIEKRENFLGWTKYKIVDIY